ncbi:hypothetical protein BJQ94_01045 [Cryobacterium sp. SO2]|uniref:hypothetical protein n=1 Tax=Cryobacterium sp. SO2 TaxID=1897060 RepID=UPI00223E89B3|nr:hypothetical protein [Cryobacterium sp. SO2]WEO77672.1 hypothetical protein BJQ94_01045 [Cryobacterium sp. SO2]
MTQLRNRIAQVDARIWFGCALALSAAGHVVRETSFSPWLVLHALILAGIWRGSQVAWRLLVTLTAVHAALLLIFGVASLFTTALTIDINGWGLAADGAALLLLVAFRGSRLRAIRIAATHAEPARAPA